MNGSRNKSKKEVKAKSRKKKRAVLKLKATKLKKQATIMTENYRKNKKLKCVYLSSFFFASSVSFVFMMFLIFTFLALFVLSFLRLLL
jgi:hypothetical protein